MSLAAAVLVLGILYLLIVSRDFRRVAAIVLGILAVAVLLLVGWYQDNQREQRRKLEVAKTYIKTNQIELINPRVSFSSYDGSPGRISGRIRNKSAYQLESIELRLIFQDCLPKGGCETVGDEREEFYMNLPSEESRDFEHYIGGPILSPKGHIEWSYQIVSVSATTN